jgi:2-haloacid dehalogenase
VDILLSRSLYEKEISNVQSLKQLDAIFFDLDGTLIDFHIAEHRSILTILSAQGVDPSEENAHRYGEINKEHWDAYGRGEISREILLTRRFEYFFAEAGHPLAGGTEEARRIDAAYQTLLARNTVLHEGALDLVRFLHGHIPMLIATNGVYRTALAKLEVAGLSAFFPYVAASETIGKQKPDRAFFTAAMDLCGCSDPAKVLMVGDLWEADIAGAAAAGLKTCWFNPSGLPRPADSVAGPDVPGLEIRTLGELLTRLGG